MTGVIVHALTGSFFTLTTWFVAADFTLAVVVLLSGPYRWATAVRATLSIGNR